MGKPWASHREAGDFDVATSTDADESSESAGETGESDDAGADVFTPSCWSSPSRCRASSRRAVAVHRPGECDSYAEDCAEGETCVPVAEGGQWTSTVCRPVADDPAGAAEPCAIEGQPGPGLDACDVGLVCRSSDGGLSTADCRAVVASRAGAVPWIRRAAHRGSYA